MNRVLMRSKTVSDFGEQWQKFQENKGYYGSLELLKDIIEPLLKIEDFDSKKVIEIGSGSGRIVNMLLDAGAKQVMAVEPSDCFEVLKTNTQDRSDKIVYKNIVGEDLNENSSYDIIISVGVLHHIEDPELTLTKAFNALKPGGKIFIWVYGYEGNELYLSVIRPIRFITTKLPHFLLYIFCFFLNILLSIYIYACGYINLPMHCYMTQVLSKFSRKNRLLTIYDQLNPEYAKYYKRNEAEDLLINAGFLKVSAWHRHGYSWSVAGEKGKYLYAKM